MKNTVFKAGSVVFVLVAVLALVCAVAVTGGGFLDLSNIARAVCLGVAVICGILAAAMWKRSGPKG